MVDRDNDLQEFVENIVDKHQMYIHDNWLVQVTRPFYYKVFPRVVVRIGDKTKNVRNEINAEEVG